MPEGKRVEGTPQVSPFFMDWRWCTEIIKKVFQFDSDQCRFTGERMFLAGLYHGLVKALKKFFKALTRPRDHLMLRPVSRLQSSS